MSDSEASWIGSLMPLAALIGGIAGGISLHRLGRKVILIQLSNLLILPIQVTIISTALPFCLAGLLVSRATSVLVICLGRALAGLCIGAMSLSLPVYLAECLRPEVRGRLGLLPTTLGNLGVLICFICGAWLDWSQVQIHLIVHQSFFFPACNSGRSPPSPLPRHDASCARLAHFSPCQKQAAF